MTGRCLRSAALLAIAVLLATACGAPTSPTPATPVDAAPVPAATSVTPTTTPPAAAAEPTTAVTSSAAVATTAPKAATAKVERVKVPNGVGLDYQSAQDRWRAAGLHVAPAVDATGAHRLPLIDSNWVVLGQSLKAGSKVKDGSFITATVEKKS